MCFYFTILFAVFLLNSNNAAAQQKFTLSGYVKDSSNAEELIGASIFIEQLKTVGNMCNKKFDVNFDSIISY